MDELARLAEQLQSIGQAVRDQAERPRPVAAPKSSTASAQSGGSSGSILNDVLDFTGIGLGVAPLISGIASLFGGGDNSAPPPLVKFAMPAPIHIDAGVREAAPTTGFAVDNGTRPVASPQITVQVQAMDSQSFLDRSADIAAAVRQAMLTSGVLNDVIREV